MERVRVGGISYMRAPDGTEWTERRMPNGSIRVQLLPGRIVLPPNWDDIHPETKETEREKEST
jgi:hypothetical protein